MPPPTAPMDAAKFAAATRAAEFVSDGMRVGLGTGSTAAFLVRRLGERIRDEGLRFTGVPTSARTGDLAREAGVTLATLGEAKWLDLTIDGADEIDPSFALIKGGGAALLHEKIVAAASDRMIVIADAAKEVAHLGAFPLPVEVVPFGREATMILIGELLAGQDVLKREVTLRMDGDVALLTQDGHNIVDLHLARIGDPHALAAALNQIPGVIENGLFLGICDAAVIGYGDGRVTVRDKASGAVTREAVAIAPPDNIFADLDD